MWREGVQLQKDSLRCTNEEKYTKITCASPPGACGPLCQFLPHSSLTFPAPRWHLQPPTPPPLFHRSGGPAPARQPPPRTLRRLWGPAHRPPPPQDELPPPAQHARAAWPPARGPPPHCPQLPRSPSSSLVPRPSPRLPSAHTGTHPRHRQPLRPLTMNLRAFSCSTASAGSIALRRRRGRSPSQCQAAASADRNLRCPASPLHLAPLPARRMRRPQAHGKWSPRPRHRQGPGRRIGTTKPKRPRVPGHAGSRWANALSVGEGAGGSCSSAEL